MANQNITTKETISQLNDADTLLVVQNSKLRRISKKNAYGDEVSQLKEAITNLDNKVGLVKEINVDYGRSGSYSESIFTNNTSQNVDVYVSANSYRHAGSYNESFIKVNGEIKIRLANSGVNLSKLTVQPSQTLSVEVQQNADLSAKFYIGDSTLSLDIANLANESIDLKMLGWTVPVECPIQNSYANGVFTQKVGRVDLGSLSWEYQAEGTRFHSLSISSLVKASINNSTIPNAFTTAYEVATPGDTWNIKNNVVSIGTNKAVLIRDTSYTDATTFKNSLQGQYLYYELATPIIKNIDGNEVVSEIQNKLSIKATENAWAGSQLKFSLPKNNVKIYELTAISLVSDCVKTNFIIRADGTIIKKDFGYATTLSYDSNGILTVDFAKSTYWCYNLVEMSSNY